MPRPRDTHRFLLLVAGMAAGAGLAEAAARWAGVRPSWLDPSLFAPAAATAYGTRPGFRGWYAGAWVRINGLGLRGSEEEPRPGAIRLLLLGDSVAFGQGVGEEETLAAVIERRARATGIDLDVLNAAVPGFNTANEADRLAEVGTRLRPDIVVLLFVDNDIEPPLFVGFRGGTPVTAAGRYQTRRDAIGMLSAWLYAHSAAYNALRLALRRRAARTRTPDGEQAYRHRMGKEYAAGSPGLRRASAALERIRDWCAGRRVPLLVGIWSKLEPATADPFVEAVRSACDALGITCVAVHTRRRGEPAGRTRLAWDGHPNALGHRRLGNDLFAHLIRLGYLTPAHARSVP